MHYTVGNVNSSFSQLYCLKFSFKLVNICRSYEEKKTVPNFVHSLHYIIGGDSVGGTRPPIIGVGDVNGIVPPKFVIFVGTLSSVPMQFAERNK